MKRYALPALVLVALALTYWFTSSRQHAPPPSRSGPAGVDASAPPAQSEAGALASGELKGGVVGAVDRASAAPIPSEPTDEASTFRLRIVRDLGDGAGDQPVSGARVRWASDRDMQAASDIAMMRARESGFRPWTEALFCGSESTADRDGGVALPRAIDVAYVLADEGGWSGYSELHLARGEPQTEAVLRLERDLTLRVAALDPQGHPVPGVTVQLGGKRDDGAFVPWGDGRTDAEGQVVFEHAQAVEAGDRMGGAIGVRADVLGAEPVLAWAEANHGEQELELRLAPTGRLRVRFDAAPGQPYPVFGTVAVQPEGGAEVRSPYLMGRSECEFVVRCGGRYHVEARLDGLPMERHVDGPGTIGAAVEVRFDVGDEVPVLVGTVSVRGADGVRPEYVIVGTTADGKQHGRAVPVGALGRFQCALEPTFESVIGARTRVYAELPELGPVESVVPLPPLARGVVPLGEVVLEPVPPLVGCDVRIDGEVAEVEPTVYLQEFGTHPNSSGEAAWILTRAMSWFESGRLTFHGPDPGRPMRLVVGDSKLVAMDPIPVRAGQLDVRLDLSTGGDALLPVTVDSSVLAGMAAVLERADGEPLPDRRSISLFMHGEEPPGFRWRGLPPDTYRVKVFAPAGGEPLAVVDDLVVAAGQETEWPALDLTQGMAVVELSVTVEGRAPEWGIAVPRESLVARLGAKVLEDGAAEFHLPADAHAAFDIVAEGCVPRTVSLQPGRQVVALERFGHELEVRVPEDLRTALPAALWSLRVERDGENALWPDLSPATPQVLQGLASRGEQALSLEAFHAEIDSSGIGRLRLPVADGWRLRLVGRVVEDEAPAYYSYAWPTTFDVGASPIMLALPPEERARAIERLGG